MNAAELLGAARAAGLTIRADGDRLLVRPKAALTPAWRAKLTTHKAELLAALADPVAMSEQARACLSEAAVRGWTAITLGTGDVVGGSEAAWRAWLAAASLAQTVAALVVLRRAPPPGGRVLGDATPTAVLALAERASYPSLVLAPMLLRVGPGEAAWRAFVADAAPLTRDVAWRTLRTLLGKGPA